MGKKKDDNNEPEKDPIEEVLAGMGDAERKIVEAMLETMPEDIREKIANGEGRLIVSGGSSGNNPFQIGIGMMVSALTEAMSDAMMSGRDPESAAMQAGASHIATQVFTLAKSFPLQIDVIFKCFICAIAATVDQTPKAFLERAAEAAPDELVMQMLGEVDVAPETGGKNAEEIQKLNEMFNLPTADEPDTNDENKEEK